MHNSTTVIYSQDYQVTKRGPSVPISDQDQALQCYVALWFCQLSWLRLVWGTSPFRTQGGAITLGIIDLDIWRVSLFDQVGTDLCTSAPIYQIVTPCGRQTSPPLPVSTPNYDTRWQAGLWSFPSQYIKLSHQVVIDWRESPLGGFDVWCRIRIRQKRGSQCECCSLAFLQRLKQIKSENKVNKASNQEQTARRC